ncbi:MAG TPA: type II toxin-antitoxin system VapC family toxin [Stellaceae bacterium]|jgi:ribonuclease VapC|nr:type II toxin-antitoxin system VapC family toxin [Stellaceae bacterium]
MVIDTSAVVAVLLDEPTSAQVTACIEVAELRLMSAASLLEAAIIIENRKRDAGGRELDLFLYRSEIEIVPVDQNQAEIARDGWRRFGKGRIPAGLNYGDCFAYALAKSRQLPLLFVGHDFAQTDIEPAL